MLALDPELGIRYYQNEISVGNDNSPLVDDLIIPKAVNLSNNFHVKWNHTNSLLLKKYIEFKNNHSKIITLTNEDVKSFTEN